jgi:hypothetical protein
VGTSSEVPIFVLETNSAILKFKPSTTFQYIF